MQNEPNFSIADWGQTCGRTPALWPAASGLRRAKCAKRTQFPAGPGGTEGKRAKQTQFGATRPASGGELRKTKPISRLRIADWEQTCGGTPVLWPAAFGLRRAKCAKRTQFGAARLASGGESCKTNPIPRLRIADWIQTCGGTPALRPAEGKTRKTKPISATPRGTGILPVVQNHGQDVHATVPPEGGTPNEVLPAGRRKDRMITGGR